MRKLATLLSVLLLVVFSVAAGTVSAQSATALEAGQIVAGKLDNTTYEVPYTFQAKKGDILLVEMFPKPGTFDLSPALILRGTDNKPLAQNNGFSYSGSSIVYEVAADGEYTILATREGGSTGTTEGEYIIRADVVKPLAAGDSAEATIYSDNEKDVPAQFVLYPQEDGAVKLGFSQKVGDLYASLQLREWAPDGIGSTAFSIDDTSKISEGSVKVDVKAKTFYILTVRQSLSSFSFDDSEAKVQISVG
jgi:hypothetical protein